MAWGLGSFLSSKIIPASQFAPVPVWVLTYKPQGTQGGPWVSPLPVQGWSGWMRQRFYCSCQK